MEESPQDPSKNASINLHPFLNSSDTVTQFCPNTDINIYLTFISTAFTALFLFPLSAVILFIGQRRKSLSHSDIFTLHLAFLDILVLPAVSVLSYGIYMRFEETVIAGLTLVFTSSSAMMQFQISVCVERYLAVVHPVTYLRLKNKAGRRIRNATIFCIWVYSMSWIPATYLSFPNIPKLPFVLMTVISLLIVIFCCLSVLRVLRRAGPGGTANARVQVDRAKTRAFHILLAVTVVLLLYFLGIILCGSLDTAYPMLSDTCMLVYASLWFSVPCRYVLPLFFLQKVGKLDCLKQGFKARGGKCKSVIPAAEG